jgi:hypothetical protein
MHQIENLSLTNMPIALNKKLTNELLGLDGQLTWSDIEKGRSSIISVKNPREDPEEIANELQDADKRFLVFSLGNFYSKKRGHLSNLLVNIGWINIVNH